MRRKRVLFLATLTAATLTGSAAGADAVCFALTGKSWDLSTADHLDSLLIGAVGGQLIGLFVSVILLGVAARRRRPFHAFAGAAWGAAAGAVGIWIPVWILVSFSVAC